MNINDKISIIIPVWNSENFLIDTIGSVTNQTYKNIEIVCINDGSTDNSLSLLHELQKKDDRIVIIDQKNQGGSGARNTGLDNATGDYIAFLDSDDIYHPQYLEILYYKLKQNNCDLSVCRNISLNDEDSKTNQGGAHFIFTNLYDVKKIKNKRVFNFPFFQKFVMKNSIPMLMWVKLAKKEIYQNIRFSMKLPAINDILLNMEVLYNSQKCITINEELIAWRYRKTSQTNLKISDKKFDEFYNLIVELNNFLNNHKLNFIEKFFIQRLIAKKVYQLFISERIRDNTYENNKEKIKDTISKLIKDGYFRAIYLDPFKRLKLKKMIKNYKKIS